MALKLIKDFATNAGAFVNIINNSNPLTISQDGSVDDITLIAYTPFYVYNDGRRTEDNLYDVSKFYKYDTIVLTPKPFTTTVKSGTNPGTGTKIYVTETAKTVPGGTGNLNIDTGTVLTATIGAETEKILVKGIGLDGGGSYVNVVRNYKNVIGSPLNLTSDMVLTASIEHVYLSATTNFTGVVGGASLSLANITNEITAPNSNPSHADVLGKYQTIYVKAVPQLNKGVPTNDPNYLGRIPTQFKTDVYFEVSYRELPDLN